LYNRGSHDGGTQEKIDLTDDTDDDESQPEIEEVADVECRMMLMIGEAIGIRVSNLLQPAGDLANLVTQQPSISIKQFLIGQVEKRNLFAPNGANASQVTQVVILGVIPKKYQSQQSFRSGRAFFRMSLGTPGGVEAMDVLVCRDAYFRFAVENRQAGKVVADVRPKHSDWLGRDLFQIHFLACDQLRLGSRSRSPRDYVHVLELSLSSSCHSTSWRLLARWVWE
jgi:hypothetical protein